MNALPMDTSALAHIGRYFRTTGLGDVIDFERRSQFDRFEPWLRAPTRLSGEAADLYRMLHSGQAIPLSNTPLSKPDLDALEAQGFVAIDQGLVVRRRWKLTHFRDLYCVADAGDTGPSNVYVGDDSFIFSQSLLSLPRGCNGLDIGSGSGISTVALAQRCASVTGIDIVEACEDAGHVTAALNGCADRTHFHTGTIETYSPKTPFDIVIGNPPGVPVPRELNYGVAGRGGDNGLDMVMSFLQVGAALCRKDGVLAMRFQSLARGDEILAHSAILRLAQARNWDARLVVDIHVPVEVRTALTARNALALNLHLTEAEILGLLDRHMDGLSVTDYTSSLLFVRFRGSGRFSVQSIHNTVRLDTRIRPTVPRQQLKAGDVSAALAGFLAFMGNAPGILWRICDPPDVGHMVATFATICAAICASSTPREALDALYPDALRGTRIGSRGVIIPFLLAVEALLGAGVIANEG